MTAAKFFGDSMSYVTGAPRGKENGQVIFFSKPKEKISSGILSVDLTLVGEQFASSFGYEIATADVNGDKYVTRSSAPISLLFRLFASLDTLSSRKLELCSTQKNWKERASPITNCKQKSNRRPLEFHPMAKPEERDRGVRHKASDPLVVKPNAAL